MIFIRFGPFQYHIDDSSNDELITSNLEPRYLEKMSAEQVPQLEAKVHAALDQQALYLRKR